MNIGFAMWLSVGCISVIMLSVSWFFKDKPTARPAYLAFRVFSLAMLALFVVIVMADYWENSFIRLLANVCLTISAASLLLGILWRSQSSIPNSVVYLWALAFVIDNILLTSDSSGPSYLLETIGALMAAYALFKRPNRNAGDKGMVLVLLVWVGVFVFEFSMGLESQHTDTMENSFALVLAPTYVSGLVMFLISSYMLDAQHALGLLAATDSMTGLHNRRHFLKEAQKLLKSADRYQYPMSILMCDIDHFKQVNDNHGHDTGDKVIKAFSECLKRMIRTDDILARYGGEEFVVLLPQANDLAAMLVAERMREEAEVLRIKAHQGNIVRFTASFGVCQISDFNNIEISVKEADTAMYEAKNSGRNRVCLYDNPDV